MVVNLVVSKLLEGWTSNNQINQVSDSWIGFNYYDE